MAEEEKRERARSMVHVFTFTTLRKGHGGGSCWETIEVNAGACFRRGSNIALYVEEEIKNSHMEIVNRSDDIIQDSIQISIQVWQTCCRRDKKFRDEIENFRKIREEI